LDRDQVGQDAYYWEGAMAMAVDDNLRTQVTEATGNKVHQAVVRTLAGRIIGRDYQSGELLPREADLCEDLGVSRTSVREAIKVLSAKGLVEVRRRSGVRVTPVESWNLLDAEVLGWHPSIDTDTDLLASLMETRLIFEPVACELAARRGTADEHEMIRAAYEEMCRAIPGDLQQTCEADLRFHRAIIVASHNMLLTSFIGVLEAALFASFRRTNHLMERHSDGLSKHKFLLDQILARDTAGARDAMRNLLELTREDLFTAVTN
jgi:GntR family galactonate operon transcriptional repressor